MASPAWRAACLSMPALLLLFGSCAAFLPAPSSVFHGYRFSRSPVRPVRGGAVAASSSYASSSSTAGEHLLSSKKTASLPLSVYIEHTDRYQVVYNANYIKFLSRAIRHDWRLPHVVVSIANAKFKAPAKLGDHLLVESTLLADDDNHKGEGQQQEEGARTYTFRQEVRCQQADPARSFFSADVTVLPITTTSRQHQQAWGGNPKQEMVDLVNDGSCRLFRVRVWWDELVDGVVAAHHVLAYFERARTDALGGPQRLEELVAREGIMFVVARMDDYWFDASGGGQGVDDGEEVVVAGRFRAKGGTLITCQQVLLSGGGGADGGGGGGVVMAHATITLASIGAQDGKIRKVPQSVIDLLLTTCS